MAVGLRDNGMKHRLNFFLPADVHNRVRRAANARRTTEAATLRLLLEKGLEWWEELPSEKKEAV